jgi:hypothetical protein
MKREILILTVIVANITFASPYIIEVRETREINTNKNEQSNLTEAVSVYLSKRGLDESIAQQKVLNFLEGDDYTNSLMARNIISHFNEIKYEDIVAYIGECALFEKSVNLSSYADILAFLQKNNNFILQKTTLEKVEKVTLANSKMLA